MLTIIAMSVQNPELSRYFSFENRSNFSYLKGSTAWLYGCPHFASTVKEADKCIDCMPICAEECFGWIAFYNQNTVMYFDPITRQTFSYATPISCDKNTQGFCIRH